MKRYNSVYDGVYTKPNEMVEEANGDWVRWEDVEKLEAINAELLKALEKVAELFDNDMVERLFFINKAKAYHLAMAADQLRAAIAKAKGEQP